MADWVKPEILQSLPDQHSAAMELFVSQWTSAPQDCVQDAFIQFVRRAIEAIRMHAAGNDGKTTRSLSDITAAVVPDDPYLDRPFTYHLDGKRAVLTTAAEGIEEPWHEIYRYELTIRE